MEDRFDGQELKWDEVEERRRRSSWGIAAVLC
jgi:hypothetical protein